MRFDKLTLKAQEAFQSAQEIATTHQHANVDVEHIAAALLDQDGGVTRPLLEKLDADPTSIRAQIEGELERAPTVQGASSYGSAITGRMQKVFNDAFALADAMHDEYVSTEHLLVALVEEPGATGKILKTRLREIYKDYRFPDDPGV